MVVIHPLRAAALERNVKGSGGRWDAGCGPWRETSSDMLSGRPERSPSPGQPS